MDEMLMYMEAMKLINEAVSWSSEASDDKKAATAIEAINYISGVVDTLYGITRSVFPCDKEK